MASDHGGLPEPRSGAGDRAYTRQHTVSQALLQRWDRFGLGVYDRVLRAERASTASAEGWVKNFIRVDKATSEKRWQSEVEDHLGRVFAALDAGGLAEDAEAEEAARRCFALHMARSQAFREMHLRSVPGALDAVRTRVITDHDTHRIFYELYGLHAAGPGAALVVADVVAEGLKAQLDVGEFFRDQVHEQFDRMCEWLADKRLQVATALAGQFVIGDAPAVPINEDDGLAGFLAGVSLGTANLVVLPLGPSHLAAVASQRAFEEQQTFELSANAVRKMNSAQVVASVRSIYYVAGQGLDAQIECILDEQDPEVSG
jgi:hypothetical protein